MLAGEWSRAMQDTRSGSVRDFVAVGDVDIQVIGADAPVLDSEVPVRQILEQVVAKTGIPPFMLGLSWSSTERMSSQQADMLTTEITAIRRTLRRWWSGSAGCGCGCTGILAALKSCGRTSTSRTRWRTPVRPSIWSRRGSCGLRTTRRRRPRSIRREVKELEKIWRQREACRRRQQLAAINRFAKSPLRAEEVYTFSLRLCDNEVDRDWERFDTAALNTLGDLFVGRAASLTTSGRRRADRPHLPDGDGAGGRPGDRGRGRLLLAEGLGLSAADGEKRGSDRGDRGRHQAGGQRRVQRGPAGVLHLRRRKRHLPAHARAAVRGADCATWSCGIPPTHTSGPSWRCQPSGRRGS